MRTFAGVSADATLRRRLTRWGKAQYGPLPKTDDDVMILSEGYDRKKNHPTKCDRLEPENFVPEFH